VENTKSDAIAGGDNPTDDSLSESALVALMAGEDQETEEPETPDGDPEDEPEPEPEAEEVEEPEEEEPEEQPEGVEGIDFDSLTDDQWEVVRTKLKSRAAADIQALKRENRAKDETIAALQGQSQQQPTAPAKAVASRFLEGIESTEQLTGKVEELEALAETIEATLDDHEEYGPNDPFQVGDQTYTKKQLRDLSREVRFALTKAVPSKQAEIASVAESEQLLEKAKAEAVSRVPELADENSDVSKNFNALLKSPNYQKAAKAMPELMPMLHLAGAMWVKTFLEKPKAKPAQQPAATGAKPKAKPPGTPSGVAAMPPARTETKTKQIEAARKQYEATGSSNDLVKLMALESGG
jgi:hypothetical protein